jgi:hypothetical protein
VRVVLGELAEDRGLLHGGDDTRSSPPLSVVTLGCLNEGEERGGRQSCYLI